MKRIHVLIGALIVIIIFYLNRPMGWKVKYVDTKRDGIIHQQFYQGNHLILEKVLAPKSWRSYSEKGNLEREMAYARNGPFKEYYENGNVKSEGVEFKAKFDGIYREYDEQGDLIYEANYNKGRLLSERGKRRNLNY